ncbi:cyclase family protein [Alicyclobacillus dauci]|uniref:Cyclase family protein n=1 Tax=Alicyclobacillus dauci TaxID=1475485 RepID=A0ABY6Z533_9BACL|nr:cyclase family protein [Alicyclobacillus dauci]WAH37130.1 cyclase family protein [Alicyclobacillus dauci]
MLLETLSKSKIYELGHSLERDMPVYPAHPPFFMTLNNRHGDIELDCGYGSSNELVVMSGHHSTHIDALAHVSDYGKLYGGLEASDVQRGEHFKRGFRSLGVETIPPIFKRGIMLDIPRLRGKDVLDPAEAITAEDLERAATQQRVSIQPGDCVLIRTGWGRYWNDAPTFNGGRGGVPGPDIGAAEWLAKHQVFLTGADTVAYERRAPEIEGLPIHQFLIAKNGIYLIECLNLEELASAQVDEFLFVSLPLRLTGATGSPIRPVAIELHGGNL